MTDSCRPRKLDPGLAATYSRPNDLMTSIMKSEPGRSVVCTSTIEGGAFSAAISFAVGVGALARFGSDCCAWATVGVATSAAAPAAAPFKNPRRSTEDFLDLGMVFTSLGLRRGPWCSFPDCAVL